MTDPLKPSGDGRLAELLTALFETGLDDAQWAELRRMIADDPAARREYVKYVSLHAQLQSEMEWQGTPIVVGKPGEGPIAVRIIEEDDAAALAMDVEAEHASAEPSARPFLPRWAALAAAALMITSVGVWLTLVVLSPVGPTDSDRVTGEPVGVLVNVHDAQWADTDPIDAGGTVSDRPLRLTDGRVDVELESGVSVTLDGPADFTLRSKMHVELRRGVVIASVPPGAHGFRVTTPTMTVTDLGTAFGVIVDERGATRVVVLDGEVSVARIDNAGRERDARELTAGRSVAVDAQGAAFRDLRPGEVVVGGGYALPTDRGYVRRVLDEAPVAYWPLDDPTNALAVIDRSGGDLHGILYGGATPGASTTDTPAAIAPATAAVFDGTGYIDAGRSDVLGGLAGGFTVECWVRAEPKLDIERYLSVDGRLQGLRGGWGIGLTKTKDGRYVPRFTLFSVKDYDFADTPMPLGRWVHVAVVCDADFAAHLYLDGEHRGTIDGMGAGRTGQFPVQIGQMADGGERFTGSLAHLAVYDRPLSPQTIRSHAGSGETRE